MLAMTGGHRGRQMVDSWDGWGELKKLGMVHAVPVVREEKR